MDRLPPDPDWRPEPPLSHDMPCPSCGHSMHTPFVCGVALDRPDGVVLCPCHVVPIPGVLPAA